MESSQPEVRFTSRIKMKVTLLPPKVSLRGIFVSFTVAQVQSSARDAFSSFRNLVPFKTTKWTAIFACRHVWLELVTLILNETGAGNLESSEGYTAGVVGGEGVIGSGVVVFGAVVVTVVGG